MKRGGMRRSHHRGGRREMMMKKMKMMKMKKMMAMKRRGGMRRSHYRGGRREMMMKKMMKMKKMMAMKRRGEMRHHMHHRGGRRHHHCRHHHRGGRRHHMHHHSRKVDWKKLAYERKRTFSHMTKEDKAKYAKTVPMLKKMWADCMKKTKDVKKCKEMEFFASWKDAADIERHDRKEKYEWIKLMRERKATFAHMSKEDWVKFKKDMPKFKAEWAACMKKLKTLRNVRKWNSLLLGKM